MSRYGYSGSNQFQPLSPWAYVGYSVLFSIPLVGFIILVIFTFSHSNINRRSYARSYWCWLLIAFIITAIITAGVVSGLKLDFIKSSGNAVINRVRTFITDVFNTDNSGTSEILKFTNSSTARATKVDDSGTEEEPKVPSLVMEVTPEFKEAMDSYETLFDEYIAFIKKYEKDASNLSLLVDYASFTTRYADMVQKMDAIEESQLSVADEAYYLEATARIYKKLAEISSH